MLGFLKKTKLYRYAQKAVDILFDWIIKRFRLKGTPKYFVALVIVLFLSGVGYFGWKLLFPDPDRSSVIGSAIVDSADLSTANSNIVINIDGDNNTVIAPDGNETRDLLGSSYENCYTGWIPFLSEYWEGLSSGFVEVNGVFTLPDKKKMVDSVAFYFTPCKGSIKADLEFNSYSEKLINLDIYYGNWFRWEIGGRDLNSVKLYKNLEGCTAFKYAVPVETKSKYLPNGLKLPVEQPIQASMLVFLTESGKLRTELHLEFISENGQRTLIDDEFHYEFDVSWKCDEKTVLNINNDTQRIGIGLMRSHVENDELPHVHLEKFMVQEYSAEQ